MNIPRHSFTSWMIVWRRIRVRARLARLGIIDASDCPLCGLFDETVEHLFFECQYTKECCRIIDKLTGYNCDPSTLESCNDKLKTITGRFRRQVIQSCYAGLLYSIWQQRNKAGGSLSTKSSACDEEAAVGYLS
ncbi:uncharacterized protein LOC110716679 [Chenopodium quinoa]|uniref:uncharacterized protein LOC110716679 n=1 Tax=Chenopodium quinoa TaxID=63459 RepID=UPI000B76ECF5|nr:uncharacterized protein LOC110716679 [Chenopodium quinoa]